MPKNTQKALFGALRGRCPKLPKKHSGVALSRPGPKSTPVNGGQDRNSTPLKQESRPCLFGFSVKLVREQKPCFYLKTIFKLSKSFCYDPRAPLGPPKPWERDIVLEKVSGLP